MSNVSVTGLASPPVVKVKISTPSVIKVSETNSAPVIKISEAPRGKPGEKGDDGEVDLEDVSDALEIYLLENPLDTDFDIDYVLANFENGLV